MSCRQSLKTFALWCVTLTALLSAAARAQAQAPPVPASYQDLYTSLNNYLSSFNATLGSPAAYPVVYTAGLTNADANAGPQMLTSGYFGGLQLQLQALKALGVQGVTVQLGFPMLYQPILGSQYQQYVTFYTQVAQAVRAAGMKLVVENDVLNVGSPAANAWNTNAALSAMTWAQYQQARAQTAAVVAQVMQPDYLVVLQEPDTEANNAGQTNVLTPSGASSEISQIVAAVQQTGVPGIQLGAGVGTWLPNAQQYVQSFVALPLNFIDIHIYQINYQNFPIALTLASTAASAGMPVTISEAWMHKIRDSELGTLTQDQIRARDTFSFWAPLDAYFVQTMENLANYTQMSFVNMFSSNYFFAYLSYDSTQNLTPSQTLALETQQMTQANTVAGYTSTGMSFYASLVQPPDSAPPSTPSNVVGVSGSPTGDCITWNASTDNIGVAGYYVFRNGVQIATTSQLFLMDTGLTQATTYSYYVEAFDLGGNISTPSQVVQVTTKDVTPPSTPTNLAGSPNSSYVVNLTWSASTDNVGIGNYIVFAGSSPANLAQIGTTGPAVTSYNAGSLTPGTTYYFAVEAKDTNGNVSPMSAVIAVTTASLPSAPGGVGASPVSATGISLSWQASSGTLPIAYYHVLSGTSPSNLTQVAVISTLSFTVHSLSPSTTYYFAVTASDKAGDFSPSSNVVSAVTYGLPTAPASIAANPASASQITLTWAAATGSLPVQSYRVYMGSSPAVLSQVATVSTLSYVAHSLTPSSTYYFALVSIDTAGDLSPQSGTVSATTYALPAAPVITSAVAVKSTNVTLTWSPSTGSLPIAYYHIYRGTSPSNMAQIAVWNGAKTTFADLTVVTKTTYYYAIQAADSAADLSAMSATVSVTTP